jgi:hypothetical protein
MIEEISYEGIWWLPAKPEDQITGTLRFNQDKGANLDLIGSFVDHFEPGPITGKAFEADIILGKSANGKDITLYRCFETHSKTSFPGMTTSSLFAHAVFIGAHFDDAEKITFNRLSVRFTNLDEWVNVSGFNIKYDHKYRRVSVEHTIPDSITTTINSLKISLEFSRKGPGFTAVQKEASIKQEAFIRLEQDKPKPISDWTKLLYRFENFLALGTAEPTYPISVEGYNNKIVEKISEKEYPKSISIYYQLIGDPLKVKTKLPYDMFFTYKDIADRFEICLNSWFNKLEELEPVYDLYFGTLYNPHMYLDQRFLNLIQAIESYHRRMISNTELSEEDHKQRIDSILDVAPTEHSNWLKQILRYSNEPTLNKRLLDVLTLHNSAIKKFINKKKSFARKIVSTRNYFIHYDKSLAKEAARGRDLFNLTEKLDILLQICLLTELEFTPEAINAIVQKHSLKRIIED